MTMPMPGCACRPIEQHRIQIVVMRLFKMFYSTAFFKKKDIMTAFQTIILVNYSIVGNS